MNSPPKHSPERRGGGEGGSTKKVTRTEKGRRRSNQKNDATGSFLFSAFVSPAGTNKNKPNRLESLLLSVKKRTNTLDFF